jgi:hypothetical protein
VPVAKDAASSNVTNLGQLSRSTAGGNSWIKLERAIGEARSLLFFPTEGMRLPSLPVGKPGYLQAPASRISPATQG